MSAPRRFLLFAAPPLLLAGFIFYLSSLSSIRGPNFPGADKVAHLGIYAALGFLCARALFGYGHVRAARLGGALLAAAYGATDELHQLFVPGRSAEWLDLLADAVGAVLGASLYVQLATRRSDR